MQRFSTLAINQKLHSRLLKLEEEFDCAWVAEASFNKVIATLKHAINCVGAVHYDTPFTQSSSPRWSSRCVVFAHPQSSRCIDMKDIALEGGARDQHG
jgi:hypothetical protein